MSDVFVADIQKTKRIRVWLILVTLLSFFGLSVYFFITVYLASIKSEENKELEFLKGITQTLSSSIDGNQHKLITEKYSEKNAISSTEQDIDYQRIHAILKNAQTQNSIPTDIYTLVLSENASPFD